MAYSSTNGPALISQTFGTGPGFWVYKHTDDIASVAASGYFSDGYELGMKIGDAVHAVELSTAGAFVGFAPGCVTAVSSASGATVSFAATST